MSVYVDGLLDRGWRLGRSCHLIADTLDELHSFAKKIGMRRSWFQETSLPHYDLTESRRRAAVAAGAVEVDRRFVVSRIRARRREEVP